MRRRLVLALVATLTLVGLPTTALNAVAAQSFPAITSLSVPDTAITLPEKLYIDFTAAAGGSVSALVFTYHSSATSPVSFTWEYPTHQGRLTKGFRDGVRNGAYRLDAVEIRDDTNHSATKYLRDGSVSRYAWSGPGASGTHALDFRSLDFTIAGSDEDTRPPQLTSVAMKTATAQPDGAFRLSWTADEQHAVRDVEATFKHVDTWAHLSAWTSSADLAAGEAAGVVPPDPYPYNGTYVLESIKLVDSLDNWIVYNRDGSTTSHSDGDTEFEPGTHHLDFTGVSLAVSGSTRDDVPPTITSVKVVDRTLTAGGALGIDYVTDNQGKPLSEFTVLYSRLGDPVNSFWVAMPSVKDASQSGRLTSTLPYRVGTYQAQKVIAVDSPTVEGRTDNQTVWLRDGTSEGGPYASLNGHHDFNLSTLDLVVTPSALALKAVPRSGAVQLTWQSAQRAELKDLSGYRVVVSPGGRVIDVPARTTQLGQSLTVTGLHNKQAYSFAVTARSSVGPGPTATAAATPHMTANVFSPGDFNRDGRADLLGQLPTTNEVRAYRGTGAPGFRGSTAGQLYSPAPASPGGPVRGSYTFLVRDPDGIMRHVQVNEYGQTARIFDVGQGWDVRIIDGSSDFSGDKVADIVAVRWNGDVYLHRGRGDGTYRAGTRIATGWSTMQAVFAARDVTGNGTADLLTVDSAGALWVYPGTGRGTFNAKVKVGTGWGGLGSLFSGNDLTGDGKVDLGAITMDGTLRVYPGRGQARFGSGIAVSKGWAPYL